MLGSSESCQTTTFLEITCRGSHIYAACQSELEVKIWDIERHVLKRTLRGLGQCTKALFCQNDTCLAVEMEQHVRVLDVETGKSYTYTQCKKIRTT